MGKQRQRENNSENQRNREIENGEMETLSQKFAKIAKTKKIEIKR